MKNPLPTDIFGRSTRVLALAAGLAKHELTHQIRAGLSSSLEQLGSSELRTRVASVISILDGLSEKDFEGVSTRTVTQPRWEGKSMSAKDYFFEHVQPNFFFHATHTYAILRHNGVPLGKKDYLGPLSFR